MTKIHKNFFGEWPEKPWEITIWIAEPTSIDEQLRLLPQFGDIMDSLYLEGLTLGNGVYLERLGEYGFRLYVSLNDTE